MQVDMTENYMIEGGDVSIAQLVLNSESERVDSADDVVKPAYSS